MPETEKAPAILNIPDINKPVDAEIIKNSIREFLGLSIITENGLSLIRHDDITFEIFNGEILVFTSDDFIYENLDNQKTKLADFLVKYFGGRIQVKVVLEKEPGNLQRFSLKGSHGGDVNFKNKENSIGTSNVIVSEKIDLESKSAIEQKIINLFGAEDITNRIDGN